MTDLQVRSGDARRGRPVLDLSATGPFDGTVKVVPIERLVRARGATDATVFEITAAWHGPGLPGLPPVEGKVDAQDVETTTDRDLAIVAAQHAYQLLGAGELPFLRPLLDALAAGPGWERRYGAAVGDHGKAAAAGAAL